jgi:uncharacterized protein YndB with AHSA1/START domain
MANQTKITATPGGHEVIIEREFNASREQVWEAWTNPDLLKQWLGPKGYEMVVETYEAKDGGSYKYIHKDPAGNEFVFRGVFHGFYKPYKAVQTFEFQGLPEPGHVSLDTLLLEDLENGRTKVKTISVFQTPEDRDSMIQSGMEKGVREGYERLDELLAK